jgi:transposase-like protein
MNGDQTSNETLTIYLPCPRSATANFLGAELESGLLRDGQMKRARFAEMQIIGVLREHEADAKTADLARKHGVSERTLYNWKAKYGGMAHPGDLCRRPHRNVRSAAQPEPAPPIARCSNRARRRKALIAHWMKVQWQVTTEQEIAAMVRRDKRPGLNIGFPSFGASTGQSLGDE